VEKVGLSLGEGMIRGIRFMFIPVTPCLYKGKGPDRADITKYKRHEVTS
jgi:hypothetical protein